MIQTSFTVVKLLSLFGLIIFGFLLAAKGSIWHANWSDAWQMTTRNADGSIIAGVTGSAILGAIAASMVGSIFSSDAWNNVTFIAGEVKNPKLIGVHLKGKLNGWASAKDVILKLCGIRQFRRSFCLASLFWGLFPMKG